MILIDRCKIATKKLHDKLNVDATCRLEGMIEVFLVSVIFVVVDGHFDYISLGFVQPKSWKRLIGKAISKPKSKEIWRKGAPRVYIAHKTLALSYLNEAYLFTLDKNDNQHFRQENKVYIWHKVNLKEWFVNILIVVRILRIILKHLWES